MTMMVTNLRDHSQQQILECKQKDKIIDQQKETIHSLNGQIKKLKSDISGLSQQIEELINSNKAAEQQL